MPLPTLNSRPEKTINGFLSRWNASDLPIIYDIANTKFPLNTDDTTFVISSVADNGGYVQITTTVANPYVEGEWVTLDAGAFSGTFKIRGVASTTVFTIDLSFTVVFFGNVIKSYQNYATRVRIYAGINPDHPLSAQDPYTLIGTIDQIPQSNNTTLVDVRKYIKSKLSPQYLLAGNDINGWKDFYIEYAETYDEINSGVIEEFVSAFTTDESEWCHATYSALQFGNARGGNMYDYTVSFLKSDLAQWMTDFERPKVINFDPFSLSIIFDSGSDLYGDTFDYEIKSYDLNDNLLKTNEVSNIADEGYGIYRISPDYLFVDNQLTSYIIIKIFINNLDVSQEIRIDIDNKCLGDNPLVLVGDITPLNSPLEFDTVQGIHNSSILLSDTRAMNFWGGSGDDGFCQIFEIDALTGIVSGLGTPLEFDIFQGIYHSSLKLSDTRAMDFWSGVGSQGFCQIFEIDAALGTVSALGTSFNFDFNQGNHNSAIVLSDTRVMNFWSGDANDGFCQIFEINATTGSVSALGVALEFDTGQSFYNSSLKLSDTRVMNFWSGNGFTCFCQIFDIDAALGTISALGMPFNFDTSTGFYNSSIVLSATRVMNFWSGTNDDGFCQIFEIDAVAGTISALGTALEFDTGQGVYNSAILLSDTRVMNFWGGVGFDGFCQIFKIDIDQGTISALKSPLEFDTIQGIFNSVLKLGDDRVMNFWSGTDDDGFCQIFELS